MTIIRCSDGSDRQEHRTYKAHILYAGDNIDLILPIWITERMRILWHRGLFRQV